MADQEKQLANVIEDSPRIDYIINDTDNASSVLTLTKEIPTLHSAITRLIAEQPELLLEEWEELSRGQSVIILRIRASFWAEYENAVTRGRRMVLTNIIGGICVDEYFKSKIITNNKKLAAILSPPSDYTAAVKEALQAGLETVRQILSAKVIDDDGYLIPRAADVVLKAFALIDMRVKGAIVQRIDQRTLNMNMNQNLPPGHTVPVPKTMEEVEREIAELRERMYREALPAPINSTQDFEIARETIDINVQRTGAGISNYKVNTEPQMRDVNGKFKKDGE